MAVFLPDCHINFPFIKSNNLNSLEAKNLLGLSCNAQLNQDALVKKTV